jgi:pilus assembly protein CpaF
VIDRIVSPLGRHIDESSPMVDARLADGSRINAVIPPLSLVGPVLTIRRFNSRRFSSADLIELGAGSQAMFEFLEHAVRSRMNIIVSGGTGSGKTSLLNVLASFIGSQERVITIEDAAELRLGHRNLVSLEARPPNAEGRGQVSIRDLVRNALRMRPDRIIVGECRGGEALDMLQAMNTGHDGSLTTVHANSARDALARIEVMTLMAGVEMPLQAIREQIASALQIVVQQARLSDGSRKMIEISEVTGMEGGRILMQPLFRYERGRASGSEGRVGFDATGNLPLCFERRGCDSPEPGLFSDTATLRAQGRPHLLRGAA